MTFIVEEGQLKLEVLDLSPEEINSCADYVVGVIKVTLENLQGELLTNAETIYALHGALYLATKDMINHD